MARRRVSFCGAEHTECFIAFSMNIKGNEGGKVECTRFDILVAFQPVGQSLPVLAGHQRHRLSHSLCPNGPLPRSHSTPFSNGGNIAHLSANQVISQYSPRTGQYHGNFFRSSSPDSVRMSVAFPRFCRSLCPN